MSFNIDIPSDPPVDSVPSYPMPAYLNFFPGGILNTSDDPESHTYNLESYSQSQSGSRPSPPSTPRSRRGQAPEILVHKAKIADDRLRQFALLSNNRNPDTPHRLPSLSVLANAAFGRLTGVPPDATKAWADAMVLQYLDKDASPAPQSEDEIHKMKPSAMKVASESLAVELKRLEMEGAIIAQSSDESSALRPRPCGYVFKRGDIAWNCRTCQTDSTCVICDSCFRASDHDGHEVYFHRTTPGGCCDCGDAEAWKVEGCCPTHRPRTNTVVETNADDPEEAVRMAHKGLKDGIEVLKDPATALPPKFAAALGVVIGAAVNCLVQAVDGAGIGADPVQWKLRWADEAAKIWNSVLTNDDYHRSESSVTPADFLQNSLPKPLPQNFRLHLRLHNDDVHTFDEVIDALHEPRSRRNTAAAGEEHANSSLVTLREAANEMTHHVDSDGQVNVKTFNSLSTAMQGFRRLKSRGLHCAVTSTPQVDMELRAKALASWLTEISSAHPAAAVLVVHALVQVTSSQEIGGISVWSEPRTIPSWVAADEKDAVQACRKRFDAFPPHLQSSFLSCEEAEKVHSMAKKVNPAALSEIADLQFYSAVPYYLPPERYRKSPHALWGTLPSRYVDSIPITEKHPLLRRLSNPSDPHAASLAPNDLTETVFVVDTDLRKQHEADLITSSVFPHRLPGLHLVSGVGATRINALKSQSPLPNPMEFRHLLATSSFRAPMSPIILLLLLDPYPTKQLRGSIHALFLSLLTDARFKCRFAAGLGIAYRPLSTLFCAGVGTEADTPLGFTVQIFTAGSLVRALGSAPAIEKLLLSDDAESKKDEASIGVFTMPIGLTVVRCIHTNLLGATKEVHMILKNTGSANDDVSDHEANQNTNDSLLPALTYVAGEHPLMTPLPAAPDDGFLDSRSTRHKRLPHLLRDLEYVIETPGTAMRLLLPHKFPAYEGESISSRGEEILTFAIVWARLLRLAQGMDPQKRKISGGHVEYEQNRWLEAFGLSLNFAGTRDALAESPTNSSSAALAPVSEDGSHLESIHGAMGNVIAAVLKEMKHWLYREEMLETGLPMPPGGAHGTSDLSQIEALQRSTLHVSASQLAGTSESQSPSTSSKSTIALSCATTVKMTEAQLDLIESALRVEGAQRHYKTGLMSDLPTKHGVSGAVMGDWLRVPHSPLAGDSLSFHLPLHRALAKTVRSFCGVVVPDVIRSTNPKGWWKLPILDGEVSDVATSESKSLQHPLVPIIRPILRSANCRVVWSAGPDCSSQEAQQRRARSRAVSANIAVAKIIHSLADHPIRCLAAAQQIERHLWARNGSSTAGMALNYSNAPLCRSFKDLDLTLVQLSASGMSAGLGARRVFALLISRFSMDGYLCDPERRSTTGSWVNPPRLQDPEHAVVLSESFFATLCVLVTELPTPPPISSSDETWLRQSIRRELIHALAAEPRSHSSAISAASCAVGKRDESDGSAGTSAGGGLFREVFAQVLRDVGKQKSRGTRATSGPSLFELDESCCDEYDPTFFHLRRSEHQHAMDVVVNLRKQKLVKEKGKNAKDAYCLPIVCPPPKAHPRFLPCRLMLHLTPMDAAIRRSLLFALFAGSWLPPAEPLPKTESEDGMSSSGESDSNGVVVSRGSNGDVPVLTFSRRGFQPGTSPSRRGSSFSETDTLPPFSAEVLASSSVSFLEVLQLLTLQVHTLEECASLHRVQPDLDDEAKSLSSSLSINSYLRRLVGVPESLKDIWALRPAPDGPLKSMGSGANRGSILGLLIALYEHRADHGAGGSSGHGSDQGDDHGGARALAASGLKWLLRFVHALVDGAPSVAAAVKSAMTGIPIQNTSSASPTGGDSNRTIWTIDDEVLQSVRSMLSNLPDLWPKPVDDSPNKSPSADTKSKERGKAAQQRMLAMMKKKQNAFAAAMGPEDSNSEKKSGASEQEEELCIICRCDDADGENNGPLGFLGHVQRSRVSQMRGCIEIPRDSESSAIYEKYRVVGHMGCQVRETEAMDSKPVFCLPRGSIVSVKKSSVSENYDILSRRVLVKHVSEETGQVVEGWASVQSSQGYVILSPLLSLCYENTRWGNTRPIIRLCGHAAHLKCVEKHTLSLHQRAAGEQPYDGRFAANIDDGEYLCPLCKQLSNILVPRDGCIRDKSENEEDTGMKIDVAAEDRTSRLLIDGTTLRSSNLESVNRHGQKALADFGSHLLQAMSVSWERTTGARKKKHRKWHHAILQWDYEEDDSELPDKSTGVKDLLRLLRQQHVAWATIGHSAAAAEASVRGLEEVLPFGSFSKTEDPWTSYTKSKASDPMLLELTRTLTGVTGLLEVLLVEMTNNLNDGKVPDTGYSSIIGKCLADILDGRGWYTYMQDGDKSMVLWSQLTAQMASTPCHVARDGMLSQRHEARSTAAAMWTVKGIGNTTPASGEPPVPLAVNKIVSTSSNAQPEVEKDWGTLSPFVKDEASSSIPLFRPGIASAYLYTPLLAWDLNSLAGAIFSTVLLNRVEDLPSSTEILRIGQMLVVGRLMQAIVTPHGFEAPSGMDMDEEDEEGRWGPGEMEKEGMALLNLLSHCRDKIKSSTLERVYKHLEDNQSAAVTGLFGNLGRAILPFARSMILMMRAFTFAIEERKNQSKKLSKESTAEAKALDDLLDGSETLATNDGFYILKEMQGPLPSQLSEQSSTWWPQINRWLEASTVFEAHHGSRGSSILPGLSSRNNSEGQNTSNAQASSTKVLGSIPSNRGDSHARNDGISSDEEDIMIDDNPMMENESDVMGFVVDQHLGESDEELIEDMDMDDAEEIVEFANQALGQGFVGARGRSGGNEAEDSADDHSSSGSEDEDGNDLDVIFAGVSQSPLISYQPSLLGVEPIGPGRQGSMFDAKAASAVMADLSHLGLVHKKDEPVFSLIRLPKSFVELYGIVNKVKGRDEATLEDSEEIGNSETAICLLTGAVMRSGSARRPFHRSQRPPGACTIHARKNGSGIGIFFLVQKCTVLLMHNNKSAYSASLYVDEHGEEDPGLRRGRPLFLNDARYRALELLWRQQGIPREVAQIRSTSDRVIRDNWY